MDNFLPGYDQPEMQDISQQRKYADLLRQQAMEQSQGSMVSGHYVAPSITQGLAKLLKGYTAGKIDKQATGKQKALADALRGKRQEWAASMPTATTQQKYATDGMGPPQAIQNNPTNQDYMQWALKGMDIDPNMAQAGFKMADTVNAREDRNAQMEAQRAQRMQEIEMRMQDQRLAREDRAALTREMAQIKAQSGGGGNPYFQPVQTAQGVMAFNARTGKMEPVQVGGANVVGAQADPALQGQIAGAKEAGQIGAKRDSNMSGIGGIIDEAKTIMSGDGPSPTASGVGTLVDKAASVFGRTPKGAPEADRLRAIGGALVAKMPRMEGPQSNYDVDNYKEMAGRVGDSTLPIERRLAALDVVETLWRKYDKGTPSGVTRNPDTPPPGAVRRKN